MPIKYELNSIFETGIFCHFYGKSRETSWRYVHVNMMSHININKFKMVEKRLHWNAFRTWSHITRCLIECWYNVVPVFWFPPKIDLFSRKGMQTVSQTSETVNSLKRKIAWLLYRFNVLIIPDQFNCWCLFPFNTTLLVNNLFGTSHLMSDLN